MCSNCNKCGGRGAIAYENNGGCGDNAYYNNVGCGYGNSRSGGDCGYGNNCGNGIIRSLSKGFACTANRIVRGLDRSLSSCN